MALMMGSQVASGTSVNQGANSTIRRRTGSPSGGGRCESTTTAWPVTAADVDAVGDGVCQYTVEAQDGGFRGSGVPLFLQQVNDVAHRRGDVVGFLFLQFTS